MCTYWHAHSFCALLYDCPFGLPVSLVSVIMSIYVACVGLVSNDANFFSFQKLEWESLSIDLLPHPDMFSDANLARSQEGATHRDDDGAKRVFFGGERFLEGISGEAYVMQIIHFQLIFDELFVILDCYVVVEIFFFSGCLVL